MIHGTTVERDRAVAATRAALRRCPSVVRQTSPSTATRHRSRRRGRPWSRRPRRRRPRSDPLAVLARGSAHDDSGLRGLGTTGAGLSGTAAARQKRGGSGSVRRDAARADPRHARATLSAPAARLLGDPKRARNSTPNGSAQPRAGWPTRDFSPAGPRARRGSLSSRLRLDLVGTPTTAANGRLCEPPAAQRTVSFAAAAKSSRAAAELEVVMRRGLILHDGFQFRRSSAFIWYTHLEIQRERPAQGGPFSLVLLLDYGEAQNTYGGDAVGAPDLLHLNSHSRFVMSVDPSPRSSE